MGILNGDFITERYWSPRKGQNKAVKNDNGRHKFGTLQNPPNGKGQRKKIDIELSLFSLRIVKNSDLCQKRY